MRYGGDTYRSRSAPCTCASCSSRPSCSGRCRHRASLHGGWWAPRGRCCAVCRRDIGHRPSRRACQLPPVWRLVLPTTDRHRRRSTTRRPNAWPPTILQRHLSSKKSSHPEAEKVHPLRGTSRSACISIPEFRSCKLQRIAHVRASVAGGDIKTFRSIRELSAFHVLCFTGCSCWVSKSRYNSFDAQRGRCRRNRLMHTSDWCMWSLNNDQFVYWHMQVWKQQTYVLSANCIKANGTWLYMKIYHEQGIGRDCWEHEFAFPWEKRHTWQPAKLLTLCPARPHLTKAIFFMNVSEMIEIEWLVDGHWYTK